MNYRAQILSEYGDVVQVLTTALPPLDVIPNPKDAAEVARIANDEMAEIIAARPHQFVAGVATLPLCDIDAALKETDRAINELGFKGALVYTHVNGKPLDSPEFMPFYEKMAGYDLPIWIHPHRNNSMPDYKTEKESKYAIYFLFGWPYETSAAMTRLVFSGVLDKYPNLKFITHHCGGMVPFFDQRIISGYDLTEADNLELEAPYIRSLAKRPVEYFRMFYNDTAVYGSTPALMCGYSFFGAGHLLFGTDMPYDTEHGHRHIRETIRSVEQMDIPDSDRKKIFEDNARKLLRLPI